MCDDMYDKKESEEATDNPEKSPESSQDGKAELYSEGYDRIVNVEKTVNMTADKSKGKSGFIVKVIVFIFFLLLAAGAAFYYLRIWEGKFDVSQNKDNFELGSEYDLKNTLKYDPSNIIQVNIENDGGFDIMKTGSYTVKFSLLNDRRNVKEISYEYQVVDTTAPTLEVSTEEIWFSKGESFDVYDYVTSEDASGMCAIETEGTADLDIAGDYTISVWARDVNGNTSESVPIVLHVVDRDNCDFRKANFGDDPETVKRFEKAELILENKENDVFYMAYSIDFYNHDAVVVYHFNANNELSEMIVHVEEGLVTGRIKAYTDVVDGLTETYGEPTESETNKRNSNLDDETLLWLQEYMRDDKWQLGNNKIETILYADSPNDITLVCLFTSDVYKLDSSEI